MNYQNKLILCNKKYKIKINKYNNRNKNNNKNNRIKNNK